MMGIDAEKGTLILNHTLENEGTQYFSRAFALSPTVNILNFFVINL